MNKLILAIIFFSGLTLAGCNGQGNQSSKDTAGMSSFGANSNSNTLLGAGSTSVYPLFSKLLAEYGKEIHVMVNYQSVGSAAGILQLADKSADFIVTDTTLTEKQIKKMPSAILQIPVCGNIAINDPAKHVDKGSARASIYKEQHYAGRSLQRAQKVLKFLWWNVHEGQKYCKSPDAAPLSATAVSVAEKTLKSATFDGKPLLQ